MVQELPPLPRALGIASAALAGPPLVAPRRFLRAIGVKDDLRNALIARGIGVHEAGVAAGILALEAPRPQRSLWTRVAGDVVHGAMLAVALRSAEDRRRVGGALAFIGACAVADTYGAVRMTRSDALGAPPKVREAVTIRKPRDEVRAAWDAFAFESPQLKNTTADVDFVAFDEAPGDRGTEVKVNLLDGSSAPVKDDLRRFKQQLETGVVVRADGSPEGDRFFRRLKQRPAQPLEEGAQA